MKTIILTLILCLSVPNLKTEKDPIVGTWKMTKLILVFEDGTQEEQVLGKHAQHRTFTYYQDGTLIFREYLFNNKTQHFDLPGNEITKGTWQKIDNQGYKRDLKRYYQDNFRSNYQDSTDVFVFSKDQNSFQKITDFKKAGIEFSGDNKRIKEIAHFVRLR